MSIAIEDDEARLETRVIWLLLLKEGGRWSAAEIAVHLESDPEYVSRFASVMKSRGFLRRHERGATRKKFEYSVDRSCRIPRAVTMGDLIDTGAMA